MNNINNLPEECLAIQEEEIKFETIFNGSRDGILVADIETKQFILANTSICKMLDYTNDELLKMSVYDIHPKDEMKYIIDKFNSQKKVSTDIPVVRKDGTIFFVDINAFPVIINDKKLLVGFFRDVTQRQETEKILNEEKLFSETLIQSLPDLFFLVNQQGNILKSSKKLEELLGLSTQNIIGTNVFKFIHDDDKELASHKLQEVFTKGSASLEARLILTNGIRNYMLTGNIIQTELGIGVIGIGIDITQLKQTQEELNISAAKFKSITTSAQDAIIMMDYNGNISYWNDAAIKMFGYLEGEVIGQNLHNLLAPQRFHQAHLKGFEQFKQTGESQVVGKTVELAALKKDGTEFPIELSLSTVQTNSHMSSIGIIRDITQRKNDEKALERANRALRTLSAGNIALVRAVDENELLKDITNIIINNGGYALATVCYKLNDEERSIKPMAVSCANKDFNFTDYTNWANNEKGQIPTAKAIRTATTQICHDISKHRANKIWKETVLAHHYVSNIAIPLNDNGNIFGALSIYSTEVDAFDKDEVKLLEEMANDLAYGILTLRTRIENEKQTKLLNQSLEQSIQIIAATVESRDPYTAGHQRRVSQLATAIAKKMNLPDDKVTGIHFAAIIHDLGKIHIPAELLSKPGHLNKIEYMLIQTHPQAGYDILKNVQFPWPIADIILQHHEKLDGSGYPKGLKGDEILLEAQIVSVADIVEAMSSHRPYRASIGIQLAIETIHAGRGTLYRSDVVDACMELFSQGEFKFLEVNN